MMSFSKNIFKYENAICLCLVVSNILITYGWKLNLFQIISLVLLVKYFIRGHKGFPYGLPKGMYYYLGYYALTFVALWLVYGINALPVSFTLFVLFLFMYIKEVECFRFLYWYRTIAYISLVFYIIQLFIYYTIGVSISGIISFLPITIIEDVSTWLEDLNEADRFSSFFSEPAHFALFLSPLMMLEFLYFKDRKHYLRAAIVMCCLLLTQSGTALASITITLLAICFFFIMKNNASKVIIFIPILLMLVSIVFFYFVTSEMGGKLLSRTSEFTSYEGGWLSSGFVRVVRGYLVFGEYSTFEKFWGLNNSEALSQVINQRGLSHLFRYNMDGSLDLYFNAIHNILLQTGLIGVFFYILFLGSIYKNSSVYSKIIIIQLVALSFINSIFLNPMLLFYIVFAYSLKNAKQTKL